MAFINPMNPLLRGGAPVQGGEDAPPLPDLTSMLSQQLISAAMESAQNGPPQYQAPEVAMAPEQFSAEEVKRIKMESIAEFLTGLGQLTGGPGGSLGTVTEDVGGFATGERKRIQSNKDQNLQMKQQLALAETNWLNQQAQGEYERKATLAGDMAKEITKRAQDMEQLREGIKIRMQAEIDQYASDPATRGRLKELTDWVVNHTTVSGQIPPESYLRSLLSSRKIDPTPENMDLLRRSAEMGVQGSQRAERMLKERWQGSRASGDRIKALNARQSVVQKKLEQFRKTSVDPLQKKVEDAEDALASNSDELSAYLPNVDGATEEDLAAVPKEKQPLARNLWANRARLMRQVTLARRAFSDSQDTMGEYEKELEQINQELQGGDQGDLEGTGTEGTGTSTGTSSSSSGDEMGGSPEETEFNQFLDDLYGRLGLSADELAGGGKP